MKIKKGDTVLIISGKDRGKKAKVLDAFPKSGRAVVEGVNLRKKHVKPKRTGEKGQVVQLPGAMDISNMKLICSKCQKASRVGYRISGKIKVRVCKQCGQET
jgi:large subunit ribosomal protein L24